MADGYKKIVVVEDDDLLRNVIIGQLNKLYAVLPAKDGEEALRIIVKERPDLVILDLLLPRLGGVDLLAQLRTMDDKELANTPVVVLSNLSDQQSIAKTRELGISDYILKADVTLGYMANRIANLIK